MSATSPDTSDELAQAFWRATESALEIADRYQLFVWLRLHLHRFIPHDLALCLMEGASRTPAQVHVFHSVPLAGVLQDELPNARSGWWRGLAERWQRQGRRAMLVALEHAGEQEDAALRADGYDTLLVHGFDREGPQDTPPALFVFALRAPAAADEQSLRHLSLWLPVLYCTASRALARQAGEREAAAGRGAPETPLTKRELQVLVAVREARQNAEIGRQLGISPLTVKNHLRTIMRKLKARNRAQAVAEAMTLRLIS